MSTQDPTEVFLAHFGIKGMRWGVRRAEKKQLKSELKKTYTTELANEMRKRQPTIDALIKEADNLYKTHSFDGDDGGGGKTAKDRQAGKQYMKLLERADGEERAAERAASEAATKKFIEVHGSEKLSEYNLQTKPYW